MDTSKAHQCGVRKNPETGDVDRFYVEIERVLERFRASLDDTREESFELFSAKLKSERPESLIGRIPAERILTQGELETFNRELAIPHPPCEDSGSRRVVIVLKATRLCNLRCSYCTAWAEGPGQTMRFPTLVRTLRTILATPGVQSVEFVWHGGEVTVLKPKFFQKLIWLQEKLRRPNQKITNSLQTNATKLSDEWLRFIAFTGVNVGISVDGPPEVHDTRRRTKDDGPSAHLVAEGITRLRNWGIKNHGALVVVDQDMASVSPRRMLDYFDGIGVHHLDFLNFVPDNDDIANGRVDEKYLSYADFNVWLKDLFEIWYDEYRPRLRIRVLDDLLKPFESGVRPANCYFSGDCMDHVFTLEPNGDLAPCDKFIGEHGSVHGNLMHVPFGSLLAQSNYLRRERQVQKRESDQSKSCRWHSICRGACPHDRRASLRLHDGFDGSCCGLAPLLESMEAKVGHTLIESGTGNCSSQNATIKAVPTELPINLKLTEGA